MIAPDDTKFEYLAGRRHVPQGEAWEEAVAVMRTEARTGMGGPRRNLRGRPKDLTRLGPLTVGRSGTVFSECLPISGTSTHRKGEK